MTILPVSEQRLGDVLRRYGQKALLIKPQQARPATPWQVAETDDAPDDTPGDEVGQAIFMLMDRRYAARAEALPQNSETAEALVALSDSSAPPHHGDHIRFAGDLWFVDSAVPVASTGKVIFRLYVNCTK
jgi:hypothetical protein